MSAGPDLSGHGILEAHAGTGKTYTIVAMVLELLERERLELRQILLVTYTQKAAGELLERIRAGISKRVEELDDADLVAHLRLCLGQLGECWIGTIHGVALRILRSWPFESGLPFRTELVDDDDGLDLVAREVWRSNPWNLEPGDLETIAEDASVSRLFARVLEMARGRLDPDMVLLPSGAFSAEDLRRDRVEIETLREHSLRAEAALRESDGMFVPWLRPRFEQMQILERSEFSKSFQGAVESAMKSWSKILQTGRSRSRKDPRGSSSAKAIADQLAKKDRSLPSALAAETLLTEVVQEWTRLYDTALGEHEDSRQALSESILGLRAEVLASWACRTADDWKSRKQADGLVSYADMLERLRSALENEAFRTELRRRIRVGIIDEFQDTSALQWDIFRRWFLEDNPARDPRLHIVGDPKQSIYSFQGADVRTYLAACDRLRAQGASTHPLRSNWRSVPSLIQATNNLLTSVEWFGTSIAYTPENQVEPPVRDGATPLSEGELGASLQCLALEGSAGSRRAFHADTVARAIHAWIGREVSIPKGNAWVRHRLGWGDFAVVVQARSSVAAFRRAFRRAGIPWALYKEQGVFVSRAARELRAVLAALEESPTRPAARLRALLTRFFAVGLDRVDPAIHLEFGHPASQVLDHLAELSSGRKWSRLFRDLRVRTGIEGRLLAENDGDRQWMDLRQTMDEALSFLVEGKGGLSQVVEHLDRLANDRIDAGEDRNLHARSTDRERVQILTMHVSKGLEFPVVFLAPSTPGAQRGEPRWIDEADGRLRLHVAAKERGDAPLAKAQREEEIARILYVALTRAKLVTVLPVHLKSPGSSQDRLSSILEPMGESLPTGCAWMDPSNLPEPLAIGDLREPASPPRLRIDRTRILDLDLPSRRRFLSSYSAISKAVSAPGLDGRWARAEESEAIVGEAPLVDSQVDSIEPADAWLPRGAHTGDCLHELLESLLRRQDLSWCSGPETPAWLFATIERSLRLHGLSIELAADVGRLLRRILSSPLPVDERGNTIRLCELAREDRLPEVEFHCAIDAEGRVIESGTTSGAPPRGWLVGYVDLLFRHDGEWFVLDWKSTTLPGYEARPLAEGMIEHDYAFQSSLYGHVVSRARGCRHGGSVYVFLRASAADLDSRSTLPGVWSNRASAEDSRVVHERIASWLANLDSRTRTMEIPR